MIAKKTRKTNHYFKPFVFITFFILPWITTTGFAQNNPAVKVHPLSAEIGLGQTIYVQVEVENIVSLYGYDLEIRFDPKKITVVDADPNLSGIQVDFGTFLDAGLVVMNTVDAESGTIRVVLSQKNPSEPKDGSGTLLVMMFEAKKSGQTEITVQGLFSDVLGNSLEVKTIPGWITVVEQAVSSTPPTPEVLNRDDQIQVMEAQETQEVTQGLPVTAQHTATPQSMQQPFVEKTNTEQPSPTQTLISTVEEKPVIKTQVSPETETFVMTSQLNISPPVYILGGLLVFTVIAGIFFWRSRQG